MRSSNKVFIEAQSSLICISNALEIENNVCSSRFHIDNYKKKLESVGFFVFFLFFILCQYKFLIYKFTNSTMNLIHTLIKIVGEDSCTQRQLGSCTQRQL